MPNPVNAIERNRAIPDDFDERYQRAFGLLAFACNRFIVNHMRRICVELKIDLETALIWGTLAHMNVLPTIPMNANPMRVLDELGLKKRPGTRAAKTVRPDAHYRLTERNRAAQAREAQATRPS